MKLNIHRGFYALVVIINFANSAVITDPSTCSSFPCIIFQDDFDYFDNKAWHHEITMGGGGNGEFEVYVNNRSVTYTRDSTLFIKPQLVSDWKADPNFIYERELDIWGQNGENEVCTGPKWSGCKRFGTQDDNEIINPVMSGRLRTLGSFSFTYGRVEVRAKLPRGDWLWPAIWLLPEGFPYGEWPASGEIDIVEARGNDVYGSISNAHAGSTLHWGPYVDLNRFRTTHSDYSLPGGSSFPDNFHTWALEWTPDNMTWYLDDTEVLFVDPGTNFWDFGSFNQEGDLDNPWQGRAKMAPFDSNFYLVMNVAIGGTDGYFPDGMQNDPPKPWDNNSTTPMKDFWEGQSSWLPTWQQGANKISEGAALQVDYVKVTKLTPD